MKRLTHWIHVTIIALFGMMLFMSCSNRDNSGSPQEYTGMPLVILDTDIGSSTDDLFALEMLYRYEEQGLCRFGCGGRPRRRTERRIYRCDEHVLWSRGCAHRTRP